MEGGSIVETESGQRIKIVGPLGADEGAQGKIDKGVNLESGREVVVKTMFPAPTLSLAAQKKRIAFLAEKRLHEVSQAFKTPIEAIKSNSFAAYYAEYARGQSLEDHIYSGRLTLTQTICIGIVVSDLLAKLLERGVSHGDIKPANFIVEMGGKHGYKPIVSAIDLDNFSAAGFPPPCYGDEEFYAPEIAAKVAQSKPASIDERSDRFSLTVLIHLLLLRKLPVAGFDSSTEEHSKAMWSGKWLHDPFSGRPLPQVGGYPPGMLDSRLADMFRRGMGLDRDARPQATECRDTLVQTLHRLYVCPVCNNIIVNDAGRTNICPYSGHAIPCPCVVLPNGRRIPISTAHVPIGRNETGSPMVSRLHAVLRRQGLVTTIEPVSPTNPTFELVDGMWVRLANLVPVPVQPGDAFRLADTVIRIAQ